jgi:hypothetical protein
MPSGRSLPTSVLLDKSVVREALRGLQRLLLEQELPPRQELSYAAITALQDQEIAVCITEALHHILEPRFSYLAHALLLHPRVLQKGRYLRRWARRLREEGLSPEDALIVSHASFGVDESADTFGTEAVLTTDYALKARYDSQYSLIDRRFKRMTSRLRAPYSDATLPAVLTPEEMLGLLLT